MLPSREAHNGTDVLTVTHPASTLAWSGVACRHPAAEVLRQFVVPDATDSISPALDTLLTRFAGMLRHLALQRGIPEDEIADVLQNLRLRLWRAHGEGHAIARLGASYVYRAGISAALDVIRERRARRDQSRLDEVIDDPAAPEGSDPGTALERAEDARAVAEAIRTLPESRRVPVRMYLTGYTREEIANHLRWSEAKTRNLLYRGLDDLRAELRRRGVGPQGIQA